MLDNIASFPIELSIHHYISIQLNMKGILVIFAIVGCILPSCESFLRPNIYNSEVAKKNSELISQAKQLIAALEYRIKENYKIKEKTVEPTETNFADPCHKIKREITNQFANQLIKWLAKRCVESAKNYEDLVRLG